MKHRLVATAVLAVAVTLASTALAAGWTSYHEIDVLEVNEDLLGYTVRPFSLTNNSVNDPANCVPSSSTTITQIRLHQTGLTTETRELISRTLLSAFLAGRKVSLEVSSITCDGGFPVYQNVSLSRSQ